MPILKKKHDKVQTTASCMAPPVLKSPLKQNKIVRPSCQLNKSSLETNNVSRCPFKSAILNSFSDERSFSETFHNKSVKGLGCTKTYCNGSILKNNVIKINQQKDYAESREEHRQFLNEYFEGEIELGKKELVDKTYPHVRYSILGFGDSTYCYNFGAFPKLIEKFFKHLALTEIYPLDIADQVKDEEKTMYSWLKNVLMASFSEFKSHLRISHHEIDQILNSKLLRAKKIRLRSFPFSENSSMIDPIWTNLSNIYEKNLRPFEIVEKEVLGYQPNNEPILRLKLKSKDFDIDYVPGNHIEIFGQNRKEYVDFILSRLNNNPNFDELVKFEVFDESSDELWLRDKKYPVMSIRQALTQYFDITKPLSQQALKMLASQALNEKDRERLEFLATDWKSYETWKADYPNLVDVLKTFFSVNPDINTLLAVLPHMKSRFYSISSSKKNASSELDITIGVYQYKSEVYDSVHYGVCSNFLEQAPLGTIIPAEIIQGNKFTMPEDSSVPVIMICTGCGIAPFRSFWTERDREVKNSIEKKFGDFILFYGCREKKKDFLYMNELESLRERQILSEFYVAYSRDPNFPKQYVQEKIWEHSDKIFELIVSNKAHVYVCGRKMLANEVIERFKMIFRNKNLFKSSDQIEAYIREMKANNRYHEDLFN